MTDAEAPANPDVSTEEVETEGAEHETAAAEDEEQPGQSDEEAEGQADTDAESAEEDEDLEIEGKTYKVPKAVASGFMRTADYQRKTAEVARSRDEHTARVEAFNQTLEAHEAFQADFRKLNAIDHQLEQLKAVNLEEVAAEDADRAQRLHYRLFRLQNERAELVQELNRKNATRLQAREKERAQQFAATEKILATADPETGWKKGGITPEVKANLEKTGAKLGFSMEEMGQVTDPRLFKIWNLASIGLEVLEKQRAALKIGSKPDRPTPTPAKNLSKDGKGASPTTAPTDTDDDDTWLEKRNAQLRANSRRQVRRVGMF